MIKWAPPEVVDALLHDEEVEYQGYFIRYYKGKSFEIRTGDTSSNVKKGGRHVTRFYDMTNYLGMSLKLASQKYLGEGKIDTLDVELIGSDEKYWEDHLEEIIKYCKRDALLTRKLAEWWWSLVKKETGFIPRRPMSKGATAQEYFLSKCFIPQSNRIPEEVQEYYYEAYHGGRFELLQKGYFPEAHIYDIKSAYPAVIAELPDLSWGEWYRTDEYHPEAERGCYFCQVLALNKVISPFMQKNHGINQYVNGEFYIYLEAHELKYILEQMPDNAIEVIDGYFWKPSCEEKHPFRDEIVSLYEWKESEPDENIQYVVKTLMNSLGGKFIQTVGGRKGKLFNCCYAAEVSARTRVKLLEAAKLVGEIEVVGFSTDAITTTIPFTPVQTRADHLGDFVHVFSGEGVFIQSDVSSLRNNTEERERFRGYMLVEDMTGPRHTGRSVRKMLEDMGDSTELTYQVKRPYHAAECLAQPKKGFDKINRFFTETRTININNEAKRSWNREFTSARDALSHSIRSEPLWFSDDSPIEPLKVEQPAGSPLAALAAILCLP